MNSLSYFEHKVKVSTSKMSNYTRPSSFAEAEQRIRQATSADEMLDVLAVCAGFKVKPYRNVHDVIKDYDRALQIKNIFECVNASAYSKLEAHMALSHISRDVLLKVFPKAIPYYDKDKLVKKARRELTKNGMRIRKTMITDKEFYDLKKSGEVFAALEAGHKTPEGYLVFNTEEEQKRYHKFKARTQELGQECINKLKNELLKASPITKEKAQQWAEQNTTISAAVYKQLKRQGYRVEDFTKDCAEFYRLIGGKLGKIVFSRDRNDNRSFCKNENEVVINGYIDKETLFHELSHAVEFYSTQFISCSKNFILSRAASKTTKKLSELTKNLNYKDYEVAYPDHFVDPYVGQWYNDDATEVLSMGMDYLTSPDNFYKFFTFDLEHLDYILGVCLSKKQFGSKNLEFYDYEKANINEETNKKKLIDHFDDEIIRIGIADKLRPIPAKYIYSHGSMLIENHAIVETKYKRIKQYTIYEKRRTIGLARRTRSTTDLSIAQLALYLFAVRKQLARLQGDSITSIFQVAEAFIAYGEVPAWFTMNTKLPELDYD